MHDLFGFLVLALLHPPTIGLGGNKCGLPVMVCKSCSHTLLCSVWNYIKELTCLEHSYMLYVSYVVQHILLIKWWCGVLLLNVIQLGFGSLITVALDHCQWPGCGLNNQRTRIHFRIGADLLQRICIGSEVHLLSYPVSAGGSVSLMSVLDINLCQNVLVKEKKLCPYQYSVPRLT